MSNSLNGLTVESVEVFTDTETDEIDTVVLCMAGGRRFSIEADGGHLTIGEETVPV